jgi:segregation and condensation protein B
MTPIELKSALEAIIYAADEPATVEQLASVLGEEKLVVRAALDELVASYASDERGVEIRAVAGGYRVYTKPQHHDLVRRFIKSLRPPLRLTMPALETLAVIAYKQPVTQPEIQEIRGVNCAGVIETLLEKRLVTTAGRKQVIGRPILYRTSKDFLMRFGLGDLDELPSLKEFEALAREALGADDGIAAEAEPADGEAGDAASFESALTSEAASDSAPRPVTSAAAGGEAPGESPAASAAEPASGEGEPRDSESRVSGEVHDEAADTARDAVAGEAPSESADRAAEPGSPTRAESARAGVGKKAAPGGSA